MPNSIKENAELMARLVASGAVKPVPPPMTPVPLPDLAPTLNPLLRSPMPASAVRDSDTVRQFHAQAIPQQRILPLSEIQSARAGAQATSQSIFIQQGGGGGLLLETNSQRNPSQGVLNLIAGSGVQVTADRFGGVTIAGGDGLVHGDAVWEYDGAYTILRDDFIFGNLTSGTLGDLGWTLGTGNTVQGLKNDVFPYVGQLQFGPGTASANVGGGIVLPSAQGGTALNTWWTNAMWPLLDYPGWKLTWIFTIRRSLSANPTSTAFDATKLSVYVGLGNNGPNLFSVRPASFIGVRFDTDTSAPSIADTTYVLEATFNGINSTSTTRDNNQGTRGGTHNTGVSVVENAYHRLEIKCVTAGQVIVSFDGVATTFTVTQTSNVRGTSNNITVGDGFTLFSGVPTIFTTSDGYSGAAPGTIFTVSGLTGGIVADNGTYACAGVTSPDSLEVQQSLTAGIPGGTYTVTNFPALTPLAWITNDSTGGATNTSRSLAVDYFSFVWNKGLAGAATPSSSNPRYW